MTISYNWLCEYLPAGEGLPEISDPEKLGKILTAIGLEVESLYKYESIKGALSGLLVGEVTSCEKHPDADKLRITLVNTGGPEPLQIVCGASNVEAGQKVVVAPVGTTIHPTGGEPITLKKAKIRGVESQGMICAEDEVGLGSSHSGILVLPSGLKPGTPVSDYFQPVTDHIFEIGLTPNRIDAMSHLGVARDVCAYLSHHTKKEVQVRSPFRNNFKVDHQGLQMEVEIENKTACKRYSGVSIQGVTLAESPRWLQQRLISIGQKPINNIVDITNYILHETGQPLHAFDADAITGKKLLIKNLPAGTSFVTLDEKERKLSADDLMICNTEEPMCMGGVYGGLHSGVTPATRNIFLESAWFDPATTRKTSLRHGLRTEAATRFEKGTDISNTVNVLKRAAMMVTEITGGEIASDIIDVYPSPAEKAEVGLKFHYLKKLSGRNYHGDTVKNILHSLGFELLKEGADELRLSVPFSKPDVSIPADIVEEIMRIDGLDNVEIPALITIAPSVESGYGQQAAREKIAEYLAGSGFSEIFTNSITNSRYYPPEMLESSVKMINNLSEELDVMRPSMMETGLESLAYNLNRKNNDLQFFEFGKTYSVKAKGKYIEKNHLALYITGKLKTDGWKSKGEKADLYYAKGVFEKIMEVLGLRPVGYKPGNSGNLFNCLLATSGNEPVATLGMVSPETLDRFDIRQPVFYVDMDLDKLLALSKRSNIRFTEIPRYPAVQRDLSIVVDKSLRYELVEKATFGAGLNKLRSVNLFDVFESEKLGTGKKSMAVSFTFVDEEKTLTDKEVDDMMKKIITSYQNELNAEIRK